MAVQVRKDTSNVAFLRSGPTFVKENETFAQDAGRSIALAPHTVMAYNPATEKWVPLTDVDPALTVAKMVCGAFGSTPAIMQAITDGEFALSINGKAIDVTGLDFSVIDAASDTHARSVLGAFGATAAAMQAITDGSFQITVNGVAYDIINLDFSGIEAGTDTHAQAICGANGTNLAGWAAVGNGGFALTVDGVLRTLTDIDFTAVATLSEVAERINGHLGGTGVVCKYDLAGDVYHFYSTSTGEKSTITVLAAGTTTDISGAGFLNGTGAALTQGTGADIFGTVILDILNNATEGAFTFVWDGTRYTIFSEETGEESTITYLTAGSAGTDISGAGHLNGLTGTAVLTQGVGGEPFVTQMMDVINANAAGRFVALWDGAGFTFISNIAGVNSVVTVLSAVSGGAGTDISGAGHLNGLTGTGVATAGTGGGGVNIPTGIYLAESITAAALVAADVVGRSVLVGGCCTVDQNQLVLENSLTLADVVVARDASIETVMAAQGIYMEDTVDVDGYEN